MNSLYDRACAPAGVASVGIRGRDVRTALKHIRSTGKVRRDHPAQATYWHLMDHPVQLVLPDGSQAIQVHPYQALNPTERELLRKKGYAVIDVPEGAHVYRTTPGAPTVRGYLLCAAQDEHLWRRVLFPA